MKKDDIIAKETTLPIGTPVLLNVSSNEQAKSFMENDFLQEYGVLPTYKIDLVDSQQCVVLTSPVIRKEIATVMWVIDNEASIKGKDGSYRIINLDEDKDWIVIQESVPSYQSSVADMSEEQLRASIDALREQRSVLPTTKKTRTPKEVVDKNDPVALALAGMSEDKKAELMKKLGMTD